jgi:small subunit ribosomal protein S8
MYTDPIADYLTRIRNANAARLKMVETPSSSVKRAITTILFDQGYIANYKFEEDDKQGTIKIALKYNQSTKVPAITKIERASRPGLRKYSGAAEMPRVLNGLGIAIVSTSKGVITDKEARRENVGGEVLCYVY